VNESPGTRNRFDCNLAVTESWAACCEAAGGPANWWLDDGTRTMTS
jgi:hypothetical protein